MLNNRAFCFIFLVQVEASHFNLPKSSVDRAVGCQCKSHWFEAPDKHKLFSISFILHSTSGPKVIKLEFDPRAEDSHFCFFCYEKVWLCFQILFQYSFFMCLRIWIKQFKSGSTNNFSSRLREQN